VGGSNSLVLVISQIFINCVGWLWDKLQNYSLKNLNCKIRNINELSMVIGSWVYEIQGDFWRGTVRRELGFVMVYVSYGCDCVHGRWVGGVLRMFVREPWLYVWLCEWCVCESICLGVTLGVWGALWPSRCIYKSRWVDMYDLPTLWITRELNLNLK